jgi:FkbH-like protein
MSIGEFPRVLGKKLENLKFLLLGTCSTGAFVDGAIRNGHRVDHMLYDGRFDNPIPKHLESYDGVLIGLTMRYIVDDAGVRGNDLWYLRLTEEDQLQELLDKACKIIDQNVADLQRKLEGKPVFYVSFLEQSFNAPGLLLPRYSLKNPAYFTQKLNEHLSRAVANHPGAYFFDLNELASWVGKWALQDDKLSSTMHANYMSNWDYGHDENRIVKPRPAMDIFGSHGPNQRFNDLIWERLSDCIKVLRKTDSVKIAIVDLDDTMWRGIAAEGEGYDYELLEGWPIGFVEALLYFKNRGGLLAICSKNDHEVTAANFKKIWGDKITLEDFASVKINWNPKSENIRQILREVNLLAESAIMIDDNPREIDEIQAGVPGIRILGTNHYDWRRLLLMAPETQVEKVTAESRQKTELIRALQQREEDRSRMSRDEWLASLGVTLRYFVVRSVEHPHFSRLFELINKTNQFNTTGKRWGMDEITKHFADGGEAILVSSKDRTAENGIISVCLIKGEEIVQTVMSCRVFGLGIEHSLARFAQESILRRNEVVKASLIDTGKNFSCHSYFADVGFTENNGHWETRSVSVHPAWIRHDYIEIGGAELVGDKQITMPVGASAKIKVAVQNRSDTAWVEDDTKINLSYHIYAEDGSIVVHDGLRSPAWSVLNPDDSLECDVLVQAPDVKGTYKLEILPVHEGKKWFSGEQFASPSIILRVE